MATGNALLFSLTQDLMRIDSTTGREARCSAWLAEWLTAHGYRVQLQQVGDELGRNNVFATLGAAQPKVVLTTHIDCVPPFIAPRETDTHHLGRGACDAKGIMAAMIVASETLRARGVADLGLLFVIGEETDSLGAKTFTRSGLGQGIRYMIDGEPTDNIMSRGHKGVLAFSAKRRGRPGHSAYPELFDSALHGLLGDLAKLTTMPLPEDTSFGTTTVNVGRMSGGLAGNVIAEEAEADIVCRLAVPLQQAEPLIRSAFSAGTELTVKTASDPAEIFAPPGYATEVVRFGTDVPHLRPICPIALVGPGSIHHAHTEHEQLAKDEQLAGVAMYVKLVEELLRL